MGGEEEEEEEEWWREGRGMRGGGSPLRRWGERGEARDEGGAFLGGVSGERGREGTQR